MKEDLKIATQGRKMIIPKELQFTAERIMKSPMRTATADNDINAIKKHGNGSRRLQSK